MKSLTAEYAKARLAQERASQVLKAATERVRSAELTILNRMRDDEVDKVRAHGWDFAPNHRAEYKPDDWEAIYKYVRRYNRFELLQKRISSTTLKELVDAGKRPPGVKLMEWDELSVRKSPK